MCNRTNADRKYLERNVLFFLLFQLLFFFRQVLGAAADGLCGVLHAVRPGVRLPGGQALQEVAPRHRNRDILLLVLTLHLMQNMSI